MKAGIVAIALASAVLLIPVIAIAQAISYGWGGMFNMAYMGVQSAMGSYGMPGAMHGMGGMMGWGSSYMGRMSSMTNMMSMNYSQARLSGVFLVTSDIEDMEHMAILVSNRGERYALVLPAEEWIVISPNGTKAILDLEDLRRTLNNTRISVEGVYIGSMADMCSVMGCGMMGGMMRGTPMCHNLQGYPAQWGSMGGMMHGMGHMMGHHMGGMTMGNENHSDEEEHHMEGCEVLMSLPHLIVSKISFNGYTAIPNR
jgi:hypothetical protein